MDHCTRFLCWHWALVGVVIALVFPVVVRAQSTWHCTTNYYSVTGRTLAEIRESIRQSKPWKDKPTSEGFTAWRINWRFVVRPSADGCRCSSFITTTAVTVTLPRWTAPTNASPTVKKAWEHYVAELGRHEDGHVQFARATEAELHKRINEMGVEPDCDGLKKKLNELAQCIVDDYRQRDKAYDERTEHGVKQGASLLRIDRDVDRKRE